MSGIIEIYILLPVFLGLTLLVAGIGFLLIHKTKMEKMAWTLQTQGTYRVREDRISAPYRVKGNSISIDIAQDSLTLQSPDSITSKTYFAELPMAFRVWILGNPNRRKKLQLEQDFPEIVQNFYLSSSLPRHDNSERISHGANLEVEFTMMGHPLDNSLPTIEGLTLKYWTWADELKSAGFDYKFMEFLGYKELWDAGAGSLPLSIIKHLPGFGEIMNGILPDIKGPNGTSLPGGIL